MVQHNCLWQWNSLVIEGVEEPCGHPGVAWSGSINGAPRGNYHRPSIRVQDYSHILRYCSLCLISVASFGEWTPKNENVETESEPGQIKTGQVTHTPFFSTDNAYFTTSHLTINSVTELTSNIFRKLWHKKMTVSLFLGLSKAFDTINHSTGYPFEEACTLWH